MKKTILVVLALAVLLCAIAVPAVAETRDPIEKGKFVVMDGPRGMAFFLDVPGGMSDQDAFVLATGKVASVRTSKKMGGKYIFSWPIGRVDVHEDTIWIFGENDFRPSIVEQKTKAKVDDWGATIFFLVVPVVCFFVIIMGNILFSTDVFRLVIFFIAIFASMYMGAYLDNPANVFVCMIAGLIVGGIAGGSIGIFPGSFALMTVGDFARRCISAGDYELLKRYCIFFVCLMIVSFFIAVFLKVSAESVSRPSAVT